MSNFVSDCHCVICGPLPIGTDPQEHMASSEHLNACDIDADLRSRFYLPPQTSERSSIGGR